MTISTLMSGYSRNSGASFGTRIVSVAFSVAVIRMVPAGFSPKLAYGGDLRLDLVEARRQCCEADVRPLPSARRSAWCG